MTLPAVDSDRVAARLSLIARIWTSGRGGCCSARRPRCWVGAESSWSRPPVGCIRIPWRRVCASWITTNRFRGTMGAVSYPGSDQPLITADSGGSNGSRLRLWKTELAAFAAEAGLDITVCHLPPGTSKWNKIEHRLFSAISRNWRGRPLESHEVVIETLRATTTSTGLTVNAVLDTTTYDRGIKITDNQIAAALEATQLHRHEFHGDWNY